MKNQIKVNRMFNAFMIIPMILFLILATSAQPAFAESTVDIQWEKYEPCSELTINNEVTHTNIIAGKTTANNPVVIWCSEMPDTETQGKIVDSLKGNPGVGNLVYIVNSRTCHLHTTLKSSFMRMNAVHSRSTESRNK